MPDFVGALDQGTTSTRFIVFNRAGRIVSLAQKEHAQHTPHPGWLEHDAAEIWRNAREVTAEALIRANIRSTDLAAFGITNQRETSVLWDRRTGVPLHPAIVWQDTRVDDAVASLARAGHEARIRALTGLPLASYFSALKLQWLLDHVPDARAKAEAGDALFGTIDSWLAWNFTGGKDGGAHVTDITNASRTQLLDLRRLDCSDELLDLFNIPRACLPQIVSSSARIAEAQLELQSVPLGGMLGDQQAAMVGQVCFDKGEAKNTYGTGNFLLVNSGLEPPNPNSGLIATAAYRFGDAPACYALEGSIAITGALVQWLRDNLGIVQSAQELDTLAASVPDNGGVYIVPAFAGLYAPYWRADARGVIAGLTRFANRAHLCRAALEAAAYQTHDVAEAMARDGVHLKTLRVDGGMARSDPLMQFQADILGTEVVRPVVTETTALGAAYAAGLATGFWSGTAELRAHWQAERRWQPVMPAERRAAALSQWRKAVARSFDWA